MSEFVHLHTHSHYSLLDGLPKIDDLINEAVQYNMPALALTDHGNLHGAIEFYKKSKAAGIKPIIGVEAYLARRSLLKKEANIDTKPYHLLILAENEEGYKNLLKLVTISHLQGFYYKPRIDKEVLAKHSKGLIGLSSCIAGEIPRLLLADKTEKAKEAAIEYENIFGKGSFFIEISHHPNVEGHVKTKSRLIKLAKSLNLPLVATQDVHYIKKEDDVAQDALVAIQTNTKLKEKKRLTLMGDDFSFRSADEMADLFRENKEAIKNTLTIAERCNLNLELGRWIFPRLEIPQKKSAAERLRELSLLGLRKMNLEKRAYFERLDYEMEIINKKGYAPYFLIVADFVNWAKNHGIATNTRGSAASSLVSYSVGISNIDPLEYELPFERFLNPHRPSPPDIDIDFADDRRDEVIEYAKKKYGEEKVAQIGTFGTMMARAAVRDITRVLNHSYSIGDRIAKMIPFGGQGFPMTIKKALKINPELKQAYVTEPVTREILNLAQKIEGAARHVSVHAAGIVISPEPLVNYVPLQYEPRGEKLITQYDMYCIEDIGLLKMDFLGLTNLSILGKAVDLIKKHRDISINLEQIPLADKKTFELLGRGETTGLFQLGGRGMTRYLKELKPNRVTDIMAMIALFRPGPMANIPTYIRRRHKRESVKYLDPKLKKILGKTYGVITYQEDVLLIAIELAGYDWGSVDKLRKAIGKKNPREMAAQQKKFIEGCQRYGGLSKQKAESLWNLFDPFKGYGFNKAHAASYALVAYQTAYLKANYPVEYMTAVLTAESGNLDKLAEIINECRRMGISVLPPDINESFADFTLVREKNQELIRFGLNAIKNVGYNIVNDIIKEREEKGKFASLEDFLERISSRDLNKKVLEALIKGGAFNKLGKQSEMLGGIDKILRYHKEINRNKNSNQASLFENQRIQTGKLKLAEGQKISQEEKFRWEKDLLGLYISGHPLDKYKNRMEKQKINITTIKNFRNQTPVVVLVIIEELKKIITRNGNFMLFLKIADFTGKIEAVVFPRILENYGHLLKEDNCVIIKGKINIRNNEPALICEEIREVA
jgi:DNA polymerase-3 subunit alpha